jgi:IMP cyclohydrolase
MVPESISFLSTKEYPGRIIIIGKSKKNEKVCVVYAISARSASSQARKLELEEDTVWVKPTDKKLLRRGNIDLLIYPSIFILPQGIAVSNGKQTVDVMACLGQGGNASETLAFALQNWDFEPDAPNFTPRISGCILSNGSSALSLIKRAPDGSTLRNVYGFHLIPGRGKMIMTYRGENMDPLPSFKGEPIDVELEGTSSKQVADSVYRALAPEKGEKDFRVSVACVFVAEKDMTKFDAHIINRAERIEEEHGKI